VSATYLPLLSLPGFVCRPEGLGRPDIAALPFFRASTQQNDQACTIFPEVDAVAGSVVDAQLQHTSANAFDVRHVTLLQAGQSNGDFCGGAGTVSSYLMLCQLNRQVITPWHKKSS